MNVVHIINSLPKIGGAERLILDLSCSCKPKRLKVITWLNEDISMCDQDIYETLEVIALRPFSFTMLKQAIKWICKADILHVHLFPSLYIAAFLPKPKVYTEHNTWNKRRAHRALQILEKIFYFQYDQVIAISEATRSALVDWISPKIVPISIVNNGVSLDRFSMLKRSIKIDSQRINIGMAGSFTDQKNQDVLVRALPRLPKNVYLIFAGDGPRRFEVEQLAYNLGVDNRVLFLGNVNDMPSYYNDIDIYIQSSHWEGFGLTVVEAMASGLPCLGSNVPGLSEVIGDGQALFDNNDIEKLTSLIKKLIVSNADYERYSKFSLDRASKFSIDNTLYNYEKIYRGVISS